jgi:putative transposase
MYLPGHPYHVFQRGNNREACFVERANYQLYLDLWEQCSRRYAVAVHAYCLMTNHVHFLVTPSKTDSVSRVTRDVGSRYAQYFNRRYKRTGTLWEGRHRASLVQDEHYFLACSRYIELNPVTAGMVDEPEIYPWSSYVANAYGHDSMIVRHDEYMRLGKDKASRCLHYRELFNERLDDEDVRLIEESSHYNQPVGDARFKKRIERQYGIKFGQSSRGRPKMKLVKK